MTHQIGSSRALIKCGRTLVFCLALSIAAEANAKRAHSPTGPVEESIEALPEDGFANSEGARAAAEEFEQQALKEREREREASAENEKAKNEAKILEHQAKIDIARFEVEIKSARRETERAKTQKAAAEASRKKSEAAIAAAEKRSQQAQAERDQLQKESERLVKQAAEAKDQADKLTASADDVKAQVIALRKEREHRQADANAAIEREREAAIANNKLKAKAMPEIAAARSEIARLQSAADNANRRAQAKKADTDTVSETLARTQQELASRRADAKASGVQLEESAVSRPSARPVASIGVSPVLAAGRQMARDCNLRAEPSPASSVIQPVLKGSRVVVETAEGNWVKASPADDRSTKGFIAKFCLR
jgi:uncharacterized protein YgiM (DUF1202 family)